MRGWGVFIRGIAMGAADVVPGVSGGTVALITGIYATLIDSLRAFDVSLLKWLLRGEVKKAWRHVNGGFLLTLFAGVAVSILLLAKLITAVLQSHPEEIYSLFMGLILASSWLLLKDIGVWRARYAFALLAGLIFMLGVSEIRPMTVEATPLVLFLGGSIAICAMILPGISGSFLLLMMGLYQSVLLAVDQFDVGTLVIFALGCITGLLSFVRLLSWLLHHYREWLMSFLVGVLLGSLKVLWPWKQAGEPLPVGSHEWLFALTAFTLGVLSVYSLSVVSTRHIKKI